MEKCDLFAIVKDNCKRSEIDIKENIINSDSYCSYCNTDTKKSIKGEIICVSCGISSGNIIDNGAEWRYYGSEDSKFSDPNRCGMPTNNLLPEFSIGSVIPFKPNESWDMKKIRNYNTWIGSCYKEKSLFNVFENMNMRAKNYGIPNCIIEDAKYKYKIISEIKISRGINRIGIIASCLFIACNENNSRRSIKEIAEIFKIPPTSMTKGLKKFNEILLVVKPEFKMLFNTGIAESIDFINRFCSNLNIDKDIINICREVCLEIDKYDLVSENTPTSKAAGSIYLVSYLFELNITKKDICNICSVSEVTISKCFTKLIDYYIYLIPEKMLKYLAIEFIYKFSKNIIKFYNKEIYNIFLKNSLELFEKSISNNILKNIKNVTFLSAGVIFYNIKLFKLDSLNITNIINIYQIKEKNILYYYNKII